MPCWYNPLKCANSSGRVAEQTTKGADEHIDRLAKRYLNTERYPAHSANVENYP
jgi:hypothetical protein